MQIWNFFKKHKIVIGSVWAFVTTCLSLYWGVYPIEHNPELTFYEKNKIDAFNLKRPINELQIFVNGRNIEQDNLNLKVYRFKLINNGDKDIRSIDYSNNSDFGLQILNGKCIRVNLDSTNDLELSNSLFNQFNSDSSLVLFNKIFIPQKHYTMLDVWLVHKKDVIPQISILGKIADTKLTITSEEESSNIGREFFAFLILIMTLFFLYLVLTGLISFFSFIQTALRKRYLKSKLEHYYDQSNIIHRILLEFYGSIGQKRFILIMNILKDYDETNSFYQEETKNKVVLEDMKNLYKNNKNKFSSSLDKLEHYYSDFLWIVEELEDAGLVIKENNGIKMNDDFLTEMSLFIRLL